MTEDNNVEVNNEALKFEVEKREGRDDFLSAITFALILIWAGVVFLASNLGWLELLNYTIDTTWKIQPIREWTEFGVWNLIALGAGGIVLLETLIRLIIPQYRRNIGGSLMVSAFCIGIGLGGWYSWNYLWPLIIIAIGINALIKGIT